MVHNAVPVKTNLPAVAAAVYFAVPKSMSKLDCTACVLHPL